MSCALSVELYVMSIGTARCRVSDTRTLSLSLVKPLSWHDLHSSKAASYVFGSPQGLRIGLAKQHINAQHTYYKTKLVLRVQCFLALRDEASQTTYLYINNAGAVYIKAPTRNRYRNNSGHHSVTMNADQGEWETLPRMLCGTTIECWQKH